MESIVYEGGPLNGQRLVRRPDHKQWPVRAKGCWSDIKIGQVIGLYMMDSRGILVWRELPGRIKLFEDNRQQAEHDRRQAQKKLNQVG